MTAYWIQFKNGKSGCVEAIGPFCAVTIAQSLEGAIDRLDIIPYPANPRLNKQVIHRKNGDFTMPSFCMHPEKCLGRSSCPRDIACDD